MNDRIPILPTRQSLLIVKQRLNGAMKGHSLLKRKSDAISVRFKALLMKISEAKCSFLHFLIIALEKASDAFYAMGTEQALWFVRESSLATFKRKIDNQNTLNDVETGCSWPSCQIIIHIDNISGIQIPLFEISRHPNYEYCINNQSSSYPEQNSSTDLYVYDKGGQQLLKTKDFFLKSLESVVELASLQLSFFLIDRVLRLTLRRVNALEYNLIPKLQSTIKYIEGELDEIDREDHYRLKITRKKKETNFINSI